MQEIVKFVVNPNTGLLITPSSTKPDEWCTVMVQSVKTLIVNDGLLVDQTRNAFLTMAVEKANQMVKSGEMVADKPVPDYLQGKIVIKESLIPFRDNQQPKVNPQTGEVITYLGQAVYRKTLLTQNPTEKDEFVKEWFGKRQMAELIPNEALESTVTNQKSDVLFEEFMQEEFAV